MYKLKNILFAGFLSICVAVASMPVELLAQEAVQEEVMQVQEEDGTQAHNLYEIVSFEGLTKEVNNRKVPVGTALEELELPETLTVSYRLHVEKPDDEGKTDQDPEDNTGDKGNGSESGNDTGDKGNESEPGNDTGNKGNESEPDGNTGNKGNESEPDGDTGNKGNGSGPGSNTGDEGNETDPGSDIGDKGNETDPGSDSGDKGNESELGGDTGGEGSEGGSGGDTGDGGHESDSVDDSVDEAVVVQTVEVHMKEYKSKPEMAVSFGTLTPDGQTAYSGMNVTADQEAGGESADDASGLNSDSESKQDAGTETDPGTEATPGTETAPGTEAGAESGAGAGAGTETDPGTETDTGTETNPGTDTGTDTNPGTETDPGTETNPGTEAGTGTETSPGTEAGTDTDTGTEAGAEPGAGSETDPGAETDTGIETDPGTETAPGTETDPSTETDPETETNPGADAGPETDSGTEKDTEKDTGAETKPNTDPSKDTEVSPTEDNDISQSIETAVIENITWLSAPEYDGDTEGCYIFTPVLPEEYILADGVALPEITVTVGEVLEPLNATIAVPGGGTISEDTVWNNAGTLSNCELIVEPGVTLTINGCISITGKVTIKGGGTIKRGSATAYFNVQSGADLTVGEITLEGSSIQSGNSMISTDNAKILLNDGCRIQNCNKNSLSGGGGAAMYVYRGEAVLNNVIIEGCSGPGYGGAICLRQTVMTVNGGTYRNNRDAGNFAGSVIYSIHSKLYVYAGRFIDNMAEGSMLSGCIFDTASVTGDFRNETHIYGGYFEGNKRASQGYGGGAILFAASYGSNLDEAIIELAGDVRFCGDGVDGSGTDGFFLDFVNYPRKVSIGSPITSPVYIHLKAQEGYVIAKGSNGYILTEKDMKQIRFTDENDSGKKWYAWLDREKNEIYLSEKVPPYGLYVYYSSNGATGRVEDNTEYASGADVTVKPADALSMEGFKFKEWNTRPDGTGESYNPGDSFKITDDITLYAIFRQGESINASFYSGGAGRRDIKSEVLGGDADSVTIKATELRDMGDWTKVGWDEKTDSYAGAIAPGTPLTIAEDTSYYGVYEREVTLSYNANRGKEADTPGSGKGNCRANVHEEITYDMAGFKVAGGITADNPQYEFVGWNTRQDGTGDLYSENDTIEIAEDTTLYATFVRLPYAAFYSGNAGEFEMRKTNVVTGNITVPELKEKSGWKGIGWDGEEDAAGFEGSIEPGAKLVLEENREYYGVYEKTVTLSYTLSSATGAEQEVVKLPASRTEKRRAKAGKSRILYDTESDDPEAFAFEIAPDPYMEGYVFMGWNTSPDGEGDYYREDDAERNRITVTEDSVLYAIFGVPPFATFYSGSAGSYVIVPSAIFGSYATGTLRAPALKEMEGWEPVGWSRSGTGYSESVELGSGSDLSITEDTFYYGIYEKKVELTYDGNGWLDPPPGTQSMSRYANVHSEITCTPAEFVVGQDIRRDGYTFLGWSLERDAGSVCYRPEDTITLEESATIYAQMVDDIAPVLGEASYNSGYRGVRDWIVRKKDLVITVPITEKGSGVNKIVYTLSPESGEPVTGEALMKDAGEPGQVRQPAAVRLEEGNTIASGGEVGLTDGQVQAKVTVSEDYKGTISLMCRDNAGNESPLKLLTAQGGGVIVEDNAPLISFRHKGTRNGRAVVGVTVYDNADENSSSLITGGIASVSYRTDNKQEQGVTDKGFAEGIVETCTFEVAVSGAGSHTIQVTAVDNAGNESSRSTRVRIARDNIITTVIKADSPPEGSSVIEPPAEVRGPEVPMQKEAPGPELPMQKEPKTGDSLPDVAVYATLAMISGLLYVLLYFTTEQGGMTESDKDEAVARLVAWAKEGGRLRRCVALVLISCVLIYYHSIGKNITYKYEMSLIYMTHM